MTKFTLTVSDHTMWKGEATPKRRLSLFLGRPGIGQKVDLDSIR